MECLHHTISEYAEECVCMEFDTAWSPPEPIFEAISAQFPELEAEIEGLQFAGTYSISDGILLDDPILPDEEIKAFAIEKFGWELYEEEDE